MATDPRFSASSGREVFTGNELLVKGALETEGGVHLLTGYPGSPVAGFFDCLGDVRDILVKNGIRAFQANNEALGAAAVNGAQMAGCRAIAAMKSVGVHVASDALALGNMAGAHPQGGAVIISGEDPWCDSTQVPADSRFLFEHLRMPVVEPGTPQELKDWISLSFKLSQAAGLYIGYIVTVAHADGGGTVDCKPNQYPALNTNQKVALDTSKIPVDQTVLLPPRTWRKELITNERFAKTIQRARELGINRILPPLPLRERAGVRGETSETNPPVSPIGFITTGMSRPYLEHVLHDLGLSGQFPILNMGLSYPADVHLVREFSKLCTTMIVIEERRSFLEKNIRDTLFHEFDAAEAAEISSRLYGKKFPKNLTGIPDTRGLNVSVLAQILIPLIKAIEEIPAHLRNGRLTAELDLIRKVSKPKLQVLSEKIVARTPTFCPGCPHRDSSSVLLEIRKNFLNPDYMKKHHNRGPVDLVAHGDTGCYTMLMFEPTKDLMHNYSGMGLGGGTGSGIDAFISNKQIVFMGDGTFFHSGQVAISHAIKSGQDITFIILENGTTAMTGHQEHPGTEFDVLGNESFIQNIEAICQAMKGTSPLTVAKMRPDDREGWRGLLENTILSDGVKVLIADKECGITHNRTKQREERKTIKEKGYLPSKTHMNVTPEVCEHCLECTKQTACPGLTIVETDYGKKIDTDLTWCVNDGACERVRVRNDYGENIKPCPSFEQVEVIRSKRKRYTLPKMHLHQLPDPKFVHDMTTAGNAWRVHMSGVGGMGIGLVGALLVRAGHKQGYRVTFQDKKGLAIRNGGVFGQITFIKDDPAGSASADAPTGVLTSVSTSPDHIISTGNIPYGKADLLLGIDILEASRAIDPREQFRVASKDRTAAVLNLYKQPTINFLLGKEDFEPESLRDIIFDHCRLENCFAHNISEICEQRLGSKQFVNIMMLGVAFQLGLIPVSFHSMAWAIKDTIRREHRRNLKAFNIGRKLALEPRALPMKPEPLTWQQLLTNKERIIRKSMRNGATWFEKYKKMVEGAITHMPLLSEPSKYDVALRIYDLIHYQDTAYARRYIDLLIELYTKDASSSSLTSDLRPLPSFSATHAAIWNLAKVMLIKDEPYVAYLLTRYEKKQRDMIKYNVDPNNGDKILYRHHTKPEFNLGPWKFRFNITTTDWQLKIAAKMKWWRSLPGWHKREIAFREWYIQQLKTIDLTDYDRAVTILKSPEAVTGFREVRYPKMDRARESVQNLPNHAPSRPSESPEDTLAVSR